MLFFRRWSYLFLLWNNIELLKFCISNCFAKYDHFDYIYTNNNFYSLLSINNCYNNTNGYNTFYIVRGNINLTNDNSTKNLNNRFSGLSIWYPNKLNSISCTIIDNFVSSRIIVFLRGNGNKYISY